MEASVPAKRLRKQVSRACDWCRARKIKCDNGQPCKACRQRDAQCTHRGFDEPRTLPQALREIDRLKRRVRELEAELSKHQPNPQSNPQPNPASIPTPDQPSSTSSPTFDSPTTCHSTPPQALCLPTFSPSPKAQWEGIFVATARTDQTSYYGPASNFYFVSRIGCYLAKALQQPFPNQTLLPRGASRNVHIGGGPRDDGDNQAVGGNMRARYMTRTQEEYMLRLFWEGYHCTMPIVDEVEFRRHYASLWEPSKPYRKPSPLADIIIALCLQYGQAYLLQVSANSSGRDGSLNDPTIAGRQYYLRSQSLLLADLESPSITTIQGYIFMAVYLCCASFQNMSHIITSQTIRAAQVLGLHLEPPADMPRHERELRKRIWYTLWIADVKISCKLGRPFLIDWTQVTVTMPSDDPGVAALNGATLGSYTPEVTWLSYAIQSHKLFFVMVDIHDALYTKFGEVLSRADLSCIYTDPEAVEVCAKLLSAKLPAMKHWVDNVPAELKMRRRGDGEPCSSSRSPVEIEALAPTWLQRQRICLELNYHNLVVNITRPFISFYSHPGTYTPITERHANTCVDHAVAFTHIMHQAVVESELMGGWSEYFVLQWNTAITMVGFILAYPIHQSTLKARQALDKAVAIFNIYGTKFPVSADAGAITRDLVAKADLIAQQLSNGIMNGTEGENEANASGGLGNTNNDDGLAWLDPSRQDFPNQFMDWALSVDTFNSFERFFDMSNTAEPWAFGQP